MNSFTQKLRSTSIGLIAAAVIATPAVGHAGFFSNKVSNVTKKVTGVAKTTKSSAGKIANTGISGIKDKVSDIAGKLDEIYYQMEDNRPLLNALQNGQMVRQLTEVVEFVNESQQEYQAFAENGVHTLRGDIAELVNTMTAIGDKLNLDSKLTDQLQKAADLADRIPATFLYPLVKAGIDQKLQDLVARLTQLSDDLVLIATLPNERDVFLYPQQHRAALCSLVTDSATQLAVLNARINYDAWSIAKMSELVPEDLTVSATVVGGGGLTVAKFPAQYIFKGMSAVLEVIKLRLDNYAAIAGTLNCST